MYKAITLLAIASLLCGCAAPPHATQESLAGRWEGVADIPGHKTQVLIDFSRGDFTREDVTQGSNGTLDATISLPGERVLGKPLINVRYLSPHIHFELQATEQHIVFDGERNGDTMVGAVHGGDVEGPFSFRRTGDVPSTPYFQEEVNFRNGGVTLAGTLLIPPTKGRHPAVILIHGSSSPSRNDFRFYGDIFARRGIAALIYDKRDVGGDLGGASRVDLRDLAGDALAAVELLKARNDINPRQIGLWGHSQGGWVAPIAAAQSKDVAFVISFSGPGVTYAELNKYADAMRLRALGFSETEILQDAEAQSRVDEYVRRGGDNHMLQTFLDEAWRKPWASHTTLPRRVPTAAEIRSNLQWRNLDLDPAVYWERIHVPVLAMFGELDDVVPVPASAGRIGAALRRAGNKDVTIRIFPRASHTIQPAPDFLDTMLNWTLQRVTVVR